MRTAWLAAAALLPLACCADGGDTSSTPAALALLESSRDPTTPDRFEVWVCRVPTDTTDPTYVSDGVRLALTTSELVERIGPAVTAYFDELAHGAYSIGFVPGGEVALAPGGRGDPPRRPVACRVRPSNGRPCTSIERRQVVLTGENPQTDLLGTGDVQTVMGWTVRVERVDHASATLALTPTAR